MNELLDILFWLGLIRGYSISEFGVRVIWFWEKDTGQLYENFKERDA
jgi:hypothetical protein